MSTKRRLFQLNNTEVNQILFCDDSDTEDVLQLDNEDIRFLESDMATVQEPDSPDQVEVVIEAVAAGSVQETTTEGHANQATLHLSTDSPSTVFDDTTFKWKMMSASQQKSIAKKFEQLAKNTTEFGKVTIDLVDDPRPYQAFEKLAEFDKFLTEIVIPESVLYSQQKGHVFSTNVEEMRAFFGMQIVMGYHTLPSIRDYWSCDPTLGVPFISNIMPLKRFEELRAYLHFNNNEKMKPMNDPNHDRAFKVRPVLNHFNLCFINGMSATAEQSIDEHMIKFKGHNILKQYVKGKPVQWGFKLWCRCDSKTGYLFQFDLYTGKKTGYVEHGLGEGVVSSLTENIKNLHCQIFIDNFFNSPQLQYNLLRNGIYSAGTVRINRKNLPDKEKIPEDKKMDRGQMVCFSSNDIYFTKWMDNKGVHMLSNFLGTHPIEQLQQKSKGKKEKFAVQCPSVIHKYNKLMGGVDLMDQKKVTYQFDHRSKHKYYLRIVNDLVDIAVVNAEILYNKLNDRTDQLDSKSFRCEIAKALIGSYTSRKRAPPTSVIHSNTAKRTKLLKDCRNSTTHTMRKVENRQRCKLCTSKKVQNRTNNICVECNVHLCYVNDCNCFAAYHD